MEFTNQNNTSYRQYRLKGKYKVLKNGNIHLQYKLYNQSNDFIKEKIITLHTKEIPQKHLIHKKYCLEFKHRKNCFGSIGFEEKFKKTLKSLNITYNDKCQNANIFSLYLKHKSFYSRELGNNIHLFKVDIKLKNLKNQIVAQEIKNYTYADQEEEDFNYELQNIEALDKNLQNKFILMINKAN